MRYLILWRHGYRIGSVYLTPEVLAKFRDEFHMVLLQEDIGGTQHWEVTGIKGE